LELRELYINDMPKTFKTIPASMGNITTLRELQSKNNKKVKTLPAGVVESWGKSLQLLDMSGKKCKAKFPAELKEAMGNHFGRVLGGKLVKAKKGKGGKKKK